MANISKIKVESNTYDIKDTTARTMGNYSATEEVVGTYFGKPLYRKMITETVSANSNVGNLLVDYGITNQDMIIINSGKSAVHYGTDTGVSYAPLIYYINNTDRTQVYINWEGRLVIQNPTGNNRTFYICLEYTKTTD